MESLFILIPIALIIMAVAIRAFFWAVDHRQFEDLENAGERILFDEVEAGEVNRQQSSTPEKSSQQLSKEVQKEVQKELSKKPPQELSEQQSADVLIAAHDSSRAKSAGTRLNTDE